MPASLASHLLEQFNAVRATRAPFGQILSPSQLVLSGPMAYAPNMHGKFPIQQPFLDQSSVFANTTNAPSISGADVSSSYADMAESTAQKIAQLQAKLNKKLGPEYISQRPGPGGGPRLTYAEGWKIINLANEVFGFNGWSSSIVNLNTDFVDYDEESRRYNVGVSAVIRVTLRDGVYHEDVGYGLLENSRSKGAALDKCKKEAVTDGVKRALRNFGNLLGNCLYDKQYTQEIVKMKVSQPKFDKTMLHRRPEFQEGNSSTTSNGEKRPVSNESVPQNGNPSSRPPVPIVLPKAIGVHSYSSSSSINASMANAWKGPSAIPLNVQPVATSTPIRNTTPQYDSKTKVPSQMNESAPRAPSKPPTNQAPGTNSVLPSKDMSAMIICHAPAKDPISKASNPASRSSSVVRQMQPKPKPLQELERADTLSFDEYDDEELLAALEKVEDTTIVNDLAADIGRPIDVDEGVGSAINYEEGPACDMVISGDEETLVDGKLNVAKSIAQDSNSRRPLPSKVGNVISNLKPQSAAPARSGIMQPREIKAEQATQGLAPEDEVARQIIALRQQRKASMGNTNAAVARTAPSAPLVNQNPLPKLDQNAPPPSNKPRTTSMGGFNFPPGMKPGTGPLSSGMRQSQMVNVQAGTKRSADAMGETHGSGTVSYTSVQAARAARQPFARLDDPDGAPGKRLRA